MLHFPQDMIAFIAFDDYSEYTVQFISMNKDQKLFNTDLQTLEFEQTGTEMKKLAKGCLIIYIASPCSHATKKACV